MATTKSSQDTRLFTPFCAKRGYCPPWRSAYDVRLIWRKWGPSMTYAIPPHPVLLRNWTYGNCARCSAGKTRKCA